MHSVNDFLRISLKFSEQLIPKNTAGGAVLILSDYSLKFPDKMSGDNAW